MVRKELAVERLGRCILGRGNSKCKGPGVCLNKGACVIAEQQGGKRGWNEAMRCEGESSREVGGDQILQGFPGPGVHSLTFICERRAKSPIKLPHKTAHGRWLPFDSFGPCALNDGADAQAACASDPLRTVKITTQYSSIPGAVLRPQVGDSWPVSMTVPWSGHFWAGRTRGYLPTRGSWLPSLQLLAHVPRARFVRRDLGFSVASATVQLGGFEQVIELL